MSAQVMTCEVCKENGATTVIPYDEVGIELMRAHFEEVHPEVSVAIS